MLEFLNGIDTQLFLFFNGKYSPFWDIIMWNVSKTAIWIPLYAIILFFVFRKMKLIGFVTLSFLLLLILVADQGSVLLFKNTFHRLRPCHQAALEGLVHMVQGKCGGAYGFVSSHAANTFAFAMFASLFFNSRTFSVSIFIWAALVSYSRIYLGVHFPFDVIGGALFGLIVAIGLFRLYQFILDRYFTGKKPY